MCKGAVVTILARSSFLEAAAELCLLLDLIILGHHSSIVFEGIRIIFFEVVLLSLLVKLAICGCGLLAVIRWHSCLREEWFCFLKSVVVT